MAAKDLPLLFSFNEHQRGPELPQDTVLSSAQNDTVCFLGFVTNIWTKAQDYQIAYGVKLDSVRKNWGDANEYCRRFRVDREAHDAKLLATGTACNVSYCCTTSDLLLQYETYIEYSTVR